MDNVNIVFIGHVDHGKSTTIGRLLYDSESITDDRVEEIQKYAEELKRRFEFAYFLDALEEERKEQMTIESTRVFFKGTNRLYTIIDSPGHKEFLKNMLTGASQADAAILIVSASEGVEEQTRRHLFLLKLLRIENITVAVNKMDVVSYRRQDFEKVVKDLKDFMRSLKFDLSKVKFIPISALEGENVYQPSTNMPWARQTLIQALDSIPIKSKPHDKPLRFVVQDVYESGEERVTVGRVESGILRRGIKAVFEPSGAETLVRKILVYEGEIDKANPGRCVGILTDAESKRGEVLGSRENPPQKAQGIEGEIIILTGELRAGERLTLRCGTAAVGARVVRMLEKIDSETGKILEENPSLIRVNEAARVEFRMDHPIVVERFADLPELGRFVLVKGEKNIGAGAVLEVLQ